MRSQKGTANSDGAVTVVICVLLVWVILLRVHKDSPSSVGTDPNKVRAVQVQEVSEPNRTPVRTDANEPNEPNAVKLKPPKSWTDPN